ncbi:MAG: extracellular solute-binding protein [Clostridium sp.]
MQDKKRYLTAGLFTALFVALAGCTPTQTETSKITAPVDILSQKVSDPNRIPVTVLIKSAFNVDSFEKEVEQVFPELDLIQVNNYSANMGTAAYETRLKHDDLTDIVMTWPLDVGKEYWADRLLDLSALPFTSRYNAARLNRISQDGSLYYLPGPSQIRGILYNKTLFLEHGWTVPKDFDGFLALCAQIESTGIRSLQLGLGNAEVLDTAFVGYSLSDCFNRPIDLKWISDYNEGKGHFAEHFTPALDTFQRLIDGKVLQPGDLSITYADRELMLFSRQCAMVEDSVLMTKMGYDYTGCTDEFGLMPFFNPNNDSDWARLYPVCYIGVNKHMAEAENKEKYDLILRLLDYISSPEGQLQLIGDNGTMFSSLSSVSPPDVPEIEDISAALSQGRCTVFPVLKNAQGALREGLAGMVKGTLTGAEVAQMVDAQNTSPPAPVANPILGEAADDFSMIETGNFITDAMREESGCDIALFMDNGKDGNYNGKGICGKIYKGPLTAIDLSQILPDLRKGELGELWEVTMTGSELLHTLEYAIPVDNNRTGWFYYFSGLRMEYDPTAEPGTRIHSISDANGKKINLNRRYSVAVMDGTVPDDFFTFCTKTGISIQSVLEHALSKGPVSPSGDGRFTVVTTDD